MARDIDVMIVDECPVTRYGVKRLLQDHVGEGKFWEADRLDGLVEEIRHKCPNIVVVDIESRFGAGIELTRLLAGSSLAKVIAFSAQDSWGSVQRFLDSGGLGFVSKRCTTEEFLQTFENVVNGERFVAPSVREMASLVGYRGGATNPTGLSPREYEVAEFVANGYTSKQIAERLSVSPKTIETHRYRIFKKLDIQRSAQLVAKFFRMNSD